MVYRLSGATLFQPELKVRPAKQFVRTSDVLVVAERSTIMLAVFRSTVSSSRRPASTHRVTAASRRELRFDCPEELNRRGGVWLCAYARARRRLPTTLSRGAAAKAQKEFPQPPGCLAARSAWWVGKIGAVIFRAKAFVMPLLLSRSDPAGLREFGVESKATPVSGAAAPSERTCGLNPTPKDFRSTDFFSPRCERVYFINTALGEVLIRRR